MKTVEKEPDTQIIVPEHYDVMGALGAALLACEAKREETGSLPFVDLTHLTTTRREL